MVRRITESQAVATTKMTAADYTGSCSHCRGMVVLYVDQFMTLQAALELHCKKRGCDGSTAGELQVMLDGILAPA